MNESLQGQRTGDDVTLRIAATVNTVDEALTWIVRQLDRWDLDQPQFGAGPIWGYPIDGDEPEQYFEVWLSGTPKPGELSDT